VVLPVTRFREMHRAGDSLASDVIRDARLIVGARPQTLLDG
jgi:hypothetical protein